MTTRHLISLVTGVLFLSILAPVGLSLWLAHRQVETKFIDELDMFSTRVALRTERVGEQAKKALRHIEAFQGCLVVMSICWKCVVCHIAIAIFRKCCTSKITFRNAHLWKKKPGRRISTRNESHS